MQSRQQGFTLVELIVVIVILGILAATALPKFIDLSTDARAGVMKGVEASMRGASTMVYGKAAANGQLGATGTVKVNGADTATVCGYPAAAAISGLLELNPIGDFDIATPGTVKHANATDPATCQVVYLPPVAAAGVCPATGPSYTATAGGC